MVFKAPTTVAFWSIFLILLAPTTILASKVEYGGGNDSVVTFANDDDFIDKVLKSDSISLVQFYAPRCSNCKSIAPAYKEVANLLKGIVLVGAVDVSSGDDGPLKQIVSQFGGVSGSGGGGFPTMKIFGIDKNNPTTYEGKRDPQSIIQGTMDEVIQVVQARANKSAGAGQGRSQQPPPSGSGSSAELDDESKVVTLNEANFKEKVLDNSDVGLVAFVAPWCGHCKALLPEWAAASVDLDGEGVYLGIVDATVETSLASQYGVEGFPTIKLFPGGSNKSSDDAVDYSGGRMKDQIISAALAELDRTGVPKEIPELTGPDVLAQNCDGKNKICVLVALPHILDSGADGRNKYLDTISNAAKTLRGTSFNFVWFEGSSQLDLEDKLELTFGFPAVAALSMNKGVYTVLRGSFTEKNIGKFVSGITTGRQPTVKIAKMPEIDSVDPWDGQDGTPIEEESLEDIMGWDEDESGEL